MALIYSSHSSSCVISLALQQRSSHFYSTSVSVRNLMREPLVRRSRVDWPTAARCARGRPDRRQFQGPRRQDQQQVQALIHLTVIALVLGWISTGPNRSSVENDRDD